MNKKFSIAISLSLISALTLASLTLAAHEPAAYVEFTTDLPLLCQVNVLFINYTDPITHQKGTIPGGTTPDQNGDPYTLATAPSSPVTFLYDVIANCPDGNTYNLVSISPSNPVISGAVGAPPVTVTGHYAVPDTTAPTIAPHGDETAEATSALGAIVNYTVPATSDAVDGAGTASCVPASGAQFALGDTIVKCDAVDAAGNHAMQTSFVVHVVDTTAPVIAPHGDETVEAISALGAIVNYTVPATSDAVDGTGTAACVPASGTQFALGNTTVTCNKTDAHGNVATATAFVVHVVDTAPVTVIVPANMTVEATGPFGAVVTFSASASDVVDGALTPTCVPGSGSTFPLDTTSVVTCSATDAHNNTGSASFTVTVVDTTFPTLSLPSNITVTALNASGALVNFTASANDLVDGPVVATCSPVFGSLFPLGTRTVNCSAADSHGNTANGSFNVTVVMDTTPPVLTLPANMIVNALNASGAVVSFTASANDLLDGPVGVTCTPASGSTFPIGTTTVNCSATDSHGNSASGSFTVTVVDNTPPVLTLPSNLNVTALNASGAPVSFVASANDLVDGPVAVTCSPASGSTFPLGMTTVNCSATDSRGNNARSGFTVSVQYAATGSDCRGVPGHQILQPINTDGSSVFKAGSTVPAKFRVCGADGIAIGTDGVVSGFRLIQIISDGKVSNVDEAVASTSSDTEFRSGNQQWIFNINTKDLIAGNTYVYLITLNDGSAIQFQFTLN